jgi:hypothetical protein
VDLHGDLADQRDRRVGLDVVDGLDAVEPNLDARSLGPDAVGVPFARRLQRLGLGRGGTPGGNSSGDIFLAFSTAPFGAMPQSAGALIPQVELNAELIDPVYLAAVEAVEESVVNAIVAGTDTPTFKFPGKTIPGIDRAALAALF